MASTHIIQRQFLDVEFEGSESDALALQNRLLRLCHDDLGPALERLFGQLAPSHEHWIIDRMEIDAGAVVPGNLEHLVEAVIEELERQLKESALLIPSGRRKMVTEPDSQSAVKFGRAHDLFVGSIEVRTEPESLLQAFLYFLENGVLPWWFHLPPGQTLEEVVRESWLQGSSTESRPELFAQALAEIIRFGAVRQRFLGQFSPDFQSDLLFAVSEEAGAAVRHIFAELRKQGMTPRTPPAFFEQLWLRAFLSAVAGVRLSPAELVNESLQNIALEVRHTQAFLFDRMAALWPLSMQETGRAESRPTEQLRSKPQPMRKPADPSTPGLDLEQGVFTSCGGIVLLHPFLPRFFDSLDIARDNVLLWPDRALCLLHYLATGQSFAPEYNLLIPKVLCNLPLDAPVNSHVELTAAEQEESGALLQAVIRHWSALGDSSVENLRGSFLVRPGKLSQRDGEYLLQVEPRSYDVLLDQLPWGLGVVKLPWMQRTLWVEWRF